MPYSRDTTAEKVASDFSSHIAGKVILTTGVSPNSLGAAFVLAIAQHKPSLLILAGRSLAKLGQTASELEKTAPGVKVQTLELDLASQSSVKQAASQVAEPVIDVLVLNAGIMGVPYAKTPEGIETQFGANHFLFANLLMPKVIKAEGGGRVVSVSSNGYRLGPIRFEDMNFDVGVSDCPVFYLTDTMDY